MKTSNYRIFEQSEFRTKEWSYIIISRNSRDDRLEGANEPFVDVVA